MSGWLARGSQRGEALMSRFRGSSPLKDKEVDAGACFESFRIHWQQAWDMMQAHQTADAITTDDVNCVLNHVDQVVTLLLWDLKAADDDASAAPARGLRIFDLFLSECVLERLLAWSRRCGAFEELLRLEQLRIYETLLRQSAGALLVQRSVLRPLTELLLSCRQAEPVELHRRLVLVLGQLCAALHRQPGLLDLFLSLEPDGTASSFVIFSMLVDFVHRDGVIGQTDREALLLCMRLSGDNEQLARYIVEHSNFCPVLATGLSGLYSVLPRKLLVISEDRYQLLSSDSKQVPELHSFVCSLDFCNAVLQVCHPLIGEQLLDYVYQGFLVSVMGPALHQEGSAGAAAHPDPNSVEEIITATAYLDLFLRSIDQPGLVRTFLRLILAHRYDERRIIDTLVQRITATSKLCVVTLSLLHTLLDLNCEDVMLELVFRHLLPCTHVMVSQRPKVREPELYADTAQRLLSLVPGCCAPARPFTLQSHLSGYFEYTVDARAEPADETASIGESSGYQSFNPRLSPSPPPGEPDDALFWSLVQRAATPPALPSLEDSCARLDEERRQPPAPPPPPPAPADRLPEPEEAREQPQSPSDMFGVTPSMGPFLWLLLEQLEEATTNGFQLNLQLMTVISRLSQYPQPLLRSFLLDDSIVLQPSVRSLVQTLGSLKHRIDTEAAALPHVAGASALGARPAGGARGAAALAISQSGLHIHHRRRLQGRAAPAQSELGGLDAASVAGRRRRRFGSALVHLTGAHRGRLRVQWLLELAAIAQEHAVATDRLLFTF
ncbi:LOW QUALITY PROTEIN: protein FAM160A1-like [Pollicipes pollicipes]|uniref:LOW QUALITY PROTEIN: protein FAM160A1-like n=1 Tax=Pollicipes pollicipes TaxID=41117 RepID=UPI001884F982|nr:LOW QUALITY PROTEIN: protein FAM160A1-like [Pollicipes pollicipes]